MKTNGYVTIKNHKLFFFLLLLKSKYLSALKILYFTTSNKEKNGVVCVRKCMVCVCVLLTKRNSKIFIFKNVYNFHPIIFLNFNSFILTNFN